jgi:hypothetical protein
MLYAESARLIEHLTLSRFDGVIERGIVPEKGQGTSCCSSENRIDAVKLHLAVCFDPRFRVVEQHDRFARMERIDMGSTGEVAESEILERALKGIAQIRQSGRPLAILNEGLYEIEGIHNPIDSHVRSSLRAKHKLQAQDGALRTDTYKGAV